MPILIEIADTQKPRLQRALVAAFEAMRDRVPTSAVVAALETGGVEGVVELLRGVEDDLGPTVAELDDAIRSSGTATVRMIPGAALLNATFRFDPFASNTIDFLQSYRLNLINQISNETRNAVRQGLVEGFKIGQNPRAVARQVRDTVGLTSWQERAVRNYRKALEDLDSTALTRALRDRRFDSSVARAIRARKPLTPQQVDRMVARYRARFIKHRAETIARTESLRATSVGNRAAIRQLLADGAVDPTGVRRQWVYTQDARTRAGHRSVPRLNEGGVPLDGLYQTELGPLQFPRDPAGSAGNTINCRCTERYFMAGGGV
jgi:hypothetical protein